MDDIVGLLGLCPPATVSAGKSVFVTVCLWLIHEGVESKGEWICGV